MDESPLPNTFSRKSDEKGMESGRLGIRIRKRSWNLEREREREMTVDVCFVFWGFGVSELITYC